METVGFVVGCFRHRCRKASSEVELMETDPSIFLATQYPRRKASSEVELMETNHSPISLKSLREVARLLRKSN